MKILFTTPVLLHPPANGPTLRIENSIKALGRVSDLYVVARNSKEGIGGTEAEAFYKSICTQFAFNPSNSAEPPFFSKISRFRFKLKHSNLRQILNLPLRILSRLFRTKIFDYELIRDTKYLIAYYDLYRMDVIWFGYGNISYELMKNVKSKRPDIKIVCDTDSVWSRFVLRKLPYENNVLKKKIIEKRGRKKEIEEADWVKFCDVTTAVSEVDAQYYRNLATDKTRIKIFSNVIDLDMYRSKPEAPKSFKTPCIYLAGWFAPKSPMDWAARWVIEKVMPIAKKAIPDLHFYIIGMGSDRTLSDVHDPSITITGQLNSVLPYLCNANISIVPLTFESGTRFKILEAAACNVPIVSTTLGAEGIPVIDQRDMLIADEPQEFAQAIIRLIKDKKYALSLAQNCRILVEKGNSVDSLIEEAKAILDYLRNK